MIFRHVVADKNLIQSGLTLYKNNSFFKVRDNSSSQIVDVQTIFINPENQSLIIGTSTQGMFLLNNNEINDFDIKINNFIKENGHTCGSQITKTNYALGTFTGGIIISDSKGNPIQIIDKNSLLQNESINALFKYNSHNDELNVVWNSFINLFSCLGL